MTAPPQSLRVISCRCWPVYDARTRAWGTSTGWGKPLLVAEVLKEADNLAEPLEIQQGQSGPAWSCGGTLRCAVVGPAHGNGRMRAIGKAHDQVGINTSTDADDLTSLAMQGMMGMGDGDRCQRRLEYRCSVLWGFPHSKTSWCNSPVRSC
jgi:hypothetical protein